MSAAVFFKRLTAKIWTMSMMSSSFRATVVCAVVAATLVALPGCAKQAQKPQAAAGLPVSVVTARRADITATFTLTGVVAPRQQATLSSVISGVVEDVYVALGEHVHAGELLVKIDDSTLRAQAAEAQAHMDQLRANYNGGDATARANLMSAKVAYDNAEANLQRNEQLYKQGYVSKTALDQVQNQTAAAEASYRAAQMTMQNASVQTGNSAALADLRNAQAALDAVNAQIAQTNVTAPFDGIVTARSVDRGALASPGTALVTVSQLDPAWINVGVPDDDLAFIHNGTHVDISIDTMPGRVWRARVDVVNAAASAGTLSYLTHIVVPNPDYTLRGGMVANVRFVQATHRNVVVLPRVALYQTDAGTAVYIVSDGKAKSVPVKTGLQTQDATEVLGVEPGTQVITQRPDALQDGSVVSIIGATEGPKPSSSRTSQ